MEHKCTKKLIGSRHFQAVALLAMVTAACMRGVPGHMRQVEMRTHVSLRSPTTMVDDGGEEELNDKT